MCSLLRDSLNIVQSPINHYLTWLKLKLCPNGMRAEQYALLPEQIQVREVHVLVQQKGFRPREIIIVTTLLDSQTDTKAK